MSVRIRLMRHGKKKAPFYRVVVADQRSPRDGAFVEEIGTYNPLPNPSEISINEEKALAWLGKGAQPSGSAGQLLRRTGIWQKHLATKPKATKSKTQKSTAGTKSS
ncbi:MAG: 30S ribosomal protein S16 [Actinomycetota bacterium]